MRNIEKQLHSIAGVASVQFNGRSGSYLLSNLLDFHTSIISCPPYSVENVLDKIFELLSYFSKLEVKLDLDHFVTKFCETFPMLFKLDHKNRKMYEIFLGEKCDEVDYGVDRKEFSILFAKYVMYSVKERGTLSVSLIFYAMHLVYAECTGRNLGKKLWIVFQQHIPFSPISLQIIEKNFPVFLFFTSIRRPIKALDSHLYYHIFESPLDSKLDMYTKIFNNYCITSRRKNSKFHQAGVRFEDLHLRTEESLRLVLNVMGLPFDNAVLETTLDGKPYYFKKGHRKIVTGTRSDLDSEKSLKIFSEEDYNFLHFILKDINFYYDYDKFEPRFDIKESKYPSFRTTLKESSEKNNFLLTSLHEIMLLKPADFPSYLRLK